MSVLFESAPLPNHHFRTEIPNIVRELGLDPYELAVYLHIKSITGDGGKCYTCNKKLCEKIIIGETKLRECLDKLVNGTNKLNLKLLTKTLRKKEDGSKDTCVYTVIDIWQYNGDYFRAKFSGGTSPNEVGVPRDASQGTSPRKDKEEPLKKNPINTSPKKADHTLLNDYDESSRNFLKSLKGAKAVLYNHMIKYGAAKITQAITRAKKWKGAPNEEVAFYTALKAESWNDVDSVDDLLKKNLDHLKTLYEFDGKTISGYRIVIGKDYFEASGGTTVRSFSTLEKDFIVKVEEFMHKITKNQK